MSQQQADASSVPARGNNASSSVGDLFEASSTPTTTPLTAFEDGAAWFVNGNLGRFLSMDKFLRGHLFDFLSINDVTHLGMTCHQLRDIVLSTRSYPCIVWEERRPTTMGFHRRRVRRGEQIHAVTVTQLQRFCFVFHTSVHASIRAEFALINGIWDEHDNNRDGRECRDLNEFPFPTTPSLKFKKFHQRRSSEQQNMRLLFSTVPLCYLSWNMDIIDDDETAPWSMNVGGKVAVVYHYASQQNWTPVEEESIRLAMDLTWICAQRIAAYRDGTVYPSAEYIMQKLPRWLRQYFPASFNPVLHAPDRKTVVEFSYRPARTLAEWDSCLPRGGRDTYRIYKSNQLPPWYRDGYSWYSDDDEESDTVDEAED